MKKTFFILALGLMFSPKAYTQVISGMETAKVDDIQVRYDKVGIKNTTGVDLVAQISCDGYSWDSKSFKAYGFYDLSCGYYESTVYIRISTEGSYGNVETYKYRLKKGEVYGLIINHEKRAVDLVRIK